MTIRNRIVSTLLTTLAIGQLMFTTTRPADAASMSQSARAAGTASDHLANAEFVLVNATSGWLYLYVDGIRSVSVPPGDNGVDFVSVGFHSFRAETYDGRSVQRSGYVEEGGVTWTVTEE